MLSLFPHISKLKSHVIKKEIKDLKKKKRFFLFLGIEERRAVLV
jgi:hypothetical protein